jgi:hypothetical protein
MFHMMIKSAEELAIPKFPQADTQTACTVIVNTAAKPKKRNVNLDSSNGTLALSTILQS